MRAVELSALREAELPVLVDALAELDLTGIDYVSVHVPSRVAPEQERSVVELLAAVAERRWPLVVHPDAIHDVTLWRRFGPLLCLENMDRRKPTGRTADELACWFETFPEAGFCFDLGHARQVDPTMIEARLLLERFADRLLQLHVSEVASSSKHQRLSWLSIEAFRTLANDIPEAVPVILESPVDESEIGEEIGRARSALPLDREANVVAAFEPMQAPT
ncbi:MAG: hypothetical protein KC503_00825 [Myxococcales bacterium]|nr:hypothetical protein [Myxococcales bacterium]